jgi:hypothetical protein
VLIRQAEHGGPFAVHRWHRRFPFDVVIVLGDHVSGGQQPADVLQTCERTDTPRLDAERP